MAWLGNHPRLLVRPFFRQRLPSSLHAFYTNLRDYWPSLFIGAEGSGSGLHADWADTSAWMGLVSFGFVKTNANLFLTKPILAVGGAQTVDDCSTRTPCPVARDTAARSVRGGFVQTEHQRAPAAASGVVLRDGARAWRASVHTSGLCPPGRVHGRNRSRTFIINSCIPTMLRRRSVVCLPTCQLLM